MLRRLKISSSVLVILLVAAQVYRPERTNPPSDPRQEIHAMLAVDPRVISVMNRSCNDCHSNRTAWPRYSHVAPASWLVASDVTRGRRAVNFSEWGKYSSQEQQKRLKEVCEEVFTGEMPAFQYTVMHPSARLTAAEKAAVCGWAKHAAANFQDETGKL